MNIGKTFTVNAPQEKVWEFITTPEKVAPCVPGCEGAEETAPGEYKATIKVKVGPIKTTFKADIKNTEEQAPDFASYETRGEEGSGASRIKADSTLSLKKLSDNETEVTYSSDINLMGRLGKFGSGMMQKVADNIGNQFVGNLKEKLEEGTEEGAAETGDNEKVESESSSEEGGDSKLYWGIGIGAVVVVVLFLIFS